MMDNEANNYIKKCGTVLLAAPTVVPMCEGKYIKYPNGQDIIDDLENAKATTGINPQANNFIGHNPHGAQQYTKKRTTI